MSAESSAAAYTNNPEKGRQAPVSCPEADILIACGVHPDRVAERVSAVLNDQTDWAGLINLADNQCLLPLLSAALRRLPETRVPADVRNEIDSRAQSKTFRTLTRAGELTRLMVLLEEAGLSPITFKGLPLAWMAYGDLALRDSGDIDIYVPRAEHADALCILANQGYEKKSGGFSPHLAGSKEVAMRRREPDIEVDLHWKFCPSYFLPFDGARAAHRSVVLRSSAFYARTLRPEDHLHFLCLHGARDCWTLRELCDVAALIRNTAIDWDDLLSESDRIGSWRAVGVALAMAGNLLEADIPRDVRMRVDADSAILRIASQIASNLRANFNAAAGLGEALLHLRLLGHPARQILYLWRRAVLPNHSDAEFFGLSDSSSPLYYLLRPFRIARVGFNRLTRPRQ